MAYAAPDRAAFVTAAPVTAPVAAPARPAEAAPGPVARMVALAGRWVAYRRTLAELQALDDRTLADLGMTRGALPGIARRAARG